MVILNSSHVQQTQSETLNMIPKLLKENILEKNPITWILEMVS